MPNHQGTSITHEKLGPDDLPAKGYSTAQRIEKCKAFLRALFQSHGFLNIAATKIGVNVATIRAWRKSDPDFEEAVRAVIELTYDVLEQEAYKRALEGETELVYYQGQPVGEKTNKSDALLMWYLNNRRHTNNRRDIRIGNKPDDLTGNSNPATFEFYPENLTQEEQITLHALLAKAQKKPDQLTDQSKSDDPNAEAEPYKNPFELDQLDLTAEVIQPKNQD